LSKNYLILLFEFISESQNAFHLDQTD